MKIKTPVLFAIINLIYLWCKTKSKVTC